MNKQLVERVVAVIATIHENTDYIACAIEHGEMNPELKAIGISGSKNWEALSSKFSDIQTEVDELYLEVMNAVKLDDNDSTVEVSLDAMREFKRAGVAIKVIVDIDDDDMPVNVFTVFEAMPGMHFAF